MESHEMSPNEIHESIKIELRRRDFNKRHLNILHLINDLSWGLGKPSALIPPDCWVLCGVEKHHATEELRHLIEMKVVLCEPNMNLYQINPEFSLWQATPHKKFSYDRYFELVNLNRNGMDIDLSSHFDQQNSFPTPKKSEVSSETATTSPNHRNPSETSDGQSHGKSFFKNTGRG